MMTKTLYTILVVLILTSCSRKYDAKAPLPDSLEAAIDSNFRTKDADERDEYQHPKETLEFFGLKPEMTVVEIAPGNGYFTEILAPYLSKQGRLVLAVPRMPPNPPQFLIENEQKIQDIMLRNHEVQLKTTLMPFETIDKKNRIAKEFADMVVTFSSVHNWVATNTAPDSFKFFFEVLKPGGTLGVVQHRIHKGKKRVPKSGYMYESEVIELATKAGFKLVGKSEINANPKDKADYPDGVWTLPPYYRLGEKNKEKYEEIGESDRMTLRFVKP